MKRLYPKSILKSVTIKTIKISYKSGYKKGYRQAIEDMKNTLTK